MYMTNKLRSRRWGGMTVETALVFFPLMLCLFSIFEYGRFLFVRQVLNHASREACRFALSNNTSTTLTSDIDTLVTRHMGGLRNKDLTNFSIAITAVDGNGNDIATDLVSDIKPGKPIAVRLTGTFQTMFPTLHYMPVTLSMTSKVIMTCEGD